MKVIKTMQVSSILFLSWTMLCICFFQNWKTRIVCSTLIHSSGSLPDNLQACFGQNLLLLSLQRRMLELSIKVAASKIARDGKQRIRALAIYLGSFVPTV